MLTLLFTTTSIPTLAEAPLATERQAQPHPRQQTDSTSAVVQAPVIDIAAQVQRLSTISAFQDWKTATAQPVRALHNPEGRQNALLWSVQVSGRSAGYLVTSADGQHLYEFSRAAIPALPEQLQGRELTEGYIYAGPMLHLVYLHTGGAILDLYNLQTGETLPWGEVINHVPEPAAAVAPATTATEHAVVQSASPDSDALYATGRAGQHKRNASPKGVHPLQSYAAGDTFDRPSYLVYDAVPDKVTVTLQVTSVATLGELRYLQVRDPFNPEAEAVYIDSRFPVDVFLTASSAT